MSQKLAGVKGMNDLLPGEIEIWQHLERTARELFALYGFSEIRTPVVEDTALFVRSVGEETDIVGKEMYTFDDKAGRSLSLRPEGTAPAARAYIEHAIANQEPVTRWFYLGPMFRYERMKTGRYRQFFQLGIESYGVKEPAADVEVMEMVVHLLGKLGLTDISLNVNSLGDETCRPAYQRALVGYLTDRRAELCADCQTRLEKNPMRILDCKNPSCQEIVRAAPSVLDSLCEPCRTHFDEVRRQLELLGVATQVNPRIVRGLDYYTRTAFEFIAADPALGTASTVGGGGRYDKLIRSLGGPEVPAVGVGIGLDRLALLLSKNKARYQTPPDLFIVSVDPRSQDEAFKLAARLRREGRSVELDTRGGSVKSQMKRADKSRARFAVVLGEKEVAEQRAELKPLQGGESRVTALADLGAALGG